MTEDEVKVVLAKVMAGDNRAMPGEATTTQWLEVAQKYGWTLSEALEAVTEHRGTSTEWLQPAHITRIIRRHRAQPRAMALLEPAEAARTEHIDAVLRQVGRHLGWTREEIRGPQRFVCPHCFARPRMPCTSTITGGRERGKQVPKEEFCAQRVALASRIGWQR